jgi:CCR4-NOT transcriptional regulation complex NOT5 subunit
VVTDRFQWHVDQLAKARDWLKHGKIKIADVEEVQEGVEYYVESHMDLDFVEDELLYEPLVEASEIERDPEEDEFGSDDEDDEDDDDDDLDSGSMASTPPIKATPPRRSKDAVPALPPAPSPAKIANTAAPTLASMRAEAKAAAAAQAAAAPPGAPKTKASLLTPAALAAKTNVATGTVWIFEF